MDSSRHNINRIDPKGLEFNSQLVGKQIDGCFTRVVVSLPCIGELAGDRADVDDSAFGCDEEGSESRCDFDNCKDVDIKHLLCHL